MVEDAKYLNSTEKKALVEIMERVSKLFKVERYVLFGSKARGNATPDSDIDLLVITRDPLSWKQKERITMEFLDVNLRFDTNFSQTVVDVDSWNSAQWRLVPLHKNVAKEGVVIS